MTRSDGRTRALAAVLTALAGYVDAFGFLSTGGFLVSFMSGDVVVWPSHSPMCPGRA